MDVQIQDYRWDRKLSCRSCQQLTPRNDQQNNSKQKWFNQPNPLWCVSKHHGGYVSAWSGLMLAGLLADGDQGHVLLQRDWVIWERKRGKSRFAIPRPIKAVAILSFSRKIRTRQLFRCSTQCEPGIRIWYWQLSNWGQFWYSNSQLPLAWPV